VFYSTAVLVLRTGVKENNGDWRQLGWIAGWCGGGVVIRAIGPTDYMAMDFNPL